MYPGAHAIDHPDKLAFIMASTGEGVTYGEFETRANRLAHLLRAQGLRRLDHMAIFMENNARFLECCSAGERTGLYYTCVNSYLAPDEVAYIINDCEAQVVITSAGKRDVAVQLPERCPKVKRWLMVDADAPDPPFEPYVDAIAAYPAEPIADEQLGAAMLYHSAPLGNLSGSLRLGATAVLMEHFDAALYLDLVRRYRVTTSQVVP